MYMILLALPTKYDKIVLHILTVGDAYGKTL